MLMYSTFLHEPQLIGFGYDLEQELNVRRQPQFLGSVIPVPNADLCTPAEPQVLPVEHICRTAASSKTQDLCG